MCHLDVENDIHFMLSCPKLKKQQEQIVKIDVEDDIHFMFSCPKLKKKQEQNC